MFVNNKLDVSKQHSLAVEVGTFSLHESLFVVEIENTRTLRIRALDFRVIRGRDVGRVYFFNFFYVRHFESVAPTCSFPQGVLLVAVVAVKPFLCVSS